MQYPKPRNGAVLIRIPEEAEKRSSAGLYVPTTPGHQFRICEIIRVGTGVPELGGRDVADLEAGQRVLAKVGMKPPTKPNQLANPIQWSCIPLSKERADEAGLFLIDQQDIFTILEDEEPKPLTLTETNETNETEKSQ